MKNLIIILTLSLLVIGACGDGRKKSTDKCISIDVSKSYPKKELILQNFMDVEYISLETNNDFINQGIVMDIGEKFILVKNNVMDGNIFVYDRKGHALRIINRKGQGPEEYINFSSIILDEEKDEIFVNDHHSSKIIVYDLIGNYKRSIKHKENTIYIPIYNFDKDYLISFDANTQFYQLFNEERRKQSHFIVSKTDGSIFKEIAVPFKQAKSTALFKYDASNKLVGDAKISFEPIIYDSGNWILVEPSADTLFSYNNEYQIKPFITRIPSIQDMDPEVFLFPVIMTDRYYFMRSVKKDFNFETRNGFSTIELLYDRQEKTIHEYAIYNGDFSLENPINMRIRTLNNEEIVFVYKYDVFNLLNNLKKGQLKGQLKEIAEKLDEEDNPVLMLVKHKK
jgi:hypothetical protein